MFYVNESNAACYQFIENSGKPKHTASDAPLAVPRKENDKSFLGGEHSAVQRFALGSNRVSILMSTSRETFRV